MSQKKLDFFYNRKRAAEPESNEHLEDDVQNLPSPVPSYDEVAGQMETPVIEVEKDNGLEDDPKLGPSKKKVKRTFNLKWREEMPWIVWDMHSKQVSCRICALVENVKDTESGNWSKGFSCPTKDGWKKQTFKQHQKSKSHIAASQVPERREELKNAINSANAKALTPVPGKIMLMKDVLFAAKNEFPISAVEKLHSLVKSHLDEMHRDWKTKHPNKSDVSSPYQIQGFNDHNSNYSTYEFLDSLNEFVESQEINEFKAANAFTIHVDESTDISKTKLLLLYTQHVDCSNKVVRHMFRKVLNLQATDASAIATAITDYFESKGIEGKKLVMFTSDGAAVMLGSKNGTAIKLKEMLNAPHVIAFHCVAHLQALGVKDVCQMEKHVSFMKIEHMLNDLVGFLNTHKHKVEIKGLANIMETEYTNLEPWIAVRWLSQSQSIQSVVKNLPLLIVYLENSSKDYPAAEGLFKKLSTVESLVKIHALNDVLMHLNCLNELYQKENLHPYDVKVFADSICTLIEEFAASHETIKNSRSMRLLKSRLNSDNAAERLNYRVKMPRGSLNTEKELIDFEEKRALDEIQAFAHDVIQTVKSRVTKNDSDLLKASTIFDYRSFKNMNDKEVENALNLLVETYADFGICQDSIHEEFDLLKVQCLRNDYDWSATLWHCLQFHDVFKNLSVLSEIILCFNATNAGVERGFSLVNRLKTKTRSRTTAEHLDVLMRLQKCHSNCNNFDFESAYKIWAKETRYKTGDFAKKRNE